MDLPDVVRVVWHNAVKDTTIAMQPLAVTIEDLDGIVVAAGTPEHAAAWLKINGYHVGVGDGLWFQGDGNFTKPVKRHLMGTAYFNPPW